MHILLFPPVRLTLVAQCATKLEGFLGSKYCHIFYQYGYSTFSKQGRFLQDFLILRKENIKLFDPPLYHRAVLLSLYPPKKKKSPSPQGWCYLHCLSLYFHPPTFGGIATVMAQAPKQWLQPCKANPPCARASGIASHPTFGGLPTLGQQGMCQPMPLHCLSLYFHPLHHTIYSMLEGPLWACSRSMLPFQGWCYHASKPVFYVNPALQRPPPVLHPPSKSKICRPLRGQVGAYWPFIKIRKSNQEGQPPVPSYSPSQAPPAQSPYIRQDVRRYPPEGIRSPVLYTVFYFYNRTKSNFRSPRLGMAHGYHYQTGSPIVVDALGICCCC